MSSSALAIGQSALAAAQAGLATTGHNIANASTPGYSRQVVVQGSAGSQNTGAGFIGKGTEVVDIRRVYNELLAGQVRSAETTKTQAETYHSQISRINSLFGDSLVGLAPVLQGFFKGVQDLAANPNVAASRQAALSSAQALTARMQTLDGQLKDIAQGVNDQLRTTTDTINVYAQQIGRLNDAIEKAHGTASGKASNDLLDQRDLAIAELSKEIKTTVVKQGNSYNVFIGNGQPLVVGARTTSLVPVSSQADPTRLTVGTVSNGEAVPLAESLLTGGRLGGLLEFRSRSLDVAQNALGRIAVGLAETFNAQHALGQDQNGELGGNFFSYLGPKTYPGGLNTTNAMVTATIRDAGQLTTADYMVEVLVGADPAATPAVDGSYRISRLPDGAPIAFADFPQEIDGITFDLDPATDLPAAGDTFLIRPTVDAASRFTVAITNTAQIAAAAPVRTAATVSNSGTGTISAGVVQSLPDPASALQTPVTITFTSASTYTVTRDDNGDTLLSGDTSAAGGKTVSLNGWSVELGGMPMAGDTFRVGPNTGGVGDNRNAVLLGALQTANTLAGRTTSFQGAYGQFVSLVGNKTRELEVTSQAERRFLEQMRATHESESGVNLDEEAANLLRYQQAYQAAGKLMQTANQLFDLLLHLGN